MEKFLSLIRTIPDATFLLTVNEKLASESLGVLESLAEELGQYLLTENFDDEQIWGQISLVTKNFLKKIEEDIKIQSENLNQSEKSDEIEDTNEIESTSQENISIEKPSQIEENHLDIGIEKDFFDPEEMIRFADEAELEKEDSALSVSQSSQDEEIVDEKNSKYQEFYKDPGENSSEEEQEKIFSMVDEDEMERIEQKLISEKPWQMKGEIESKNRPKDSLLNEDLDFELGRNPVPQTQTKVITDEIEDIIKQRVLDMLYDDVRPKKPLDKPTTKTAPEDFMDYEKSRKSLAELYEEDFKKQVLHIPVNTEVERAKKDVTVMFRKLCYNLDMMSSLNPVPKPVVKDIEVKSANVPALVMEEILPFGTSKEIISNPIEIFNPKNTVLKAPEELTKSDKNTQRKRQKSTLRTRKKERIIKLINKMAQDPKSHKFEYRKMLKEQKARKELIERKKQPDTKFTKSSEFFKNFQNLNKEINLKASKEPQTSKKIKL